MVADGERGDRGDRGVAGERGPQGDHGQAGDVGATGARGPTNKLAVVGYLILAAAVAWAFWQTNENQKETDRGRVVARYILCLEVEKLKKAERTRAINARKDLQLNLRLLELRMTPEIRSVANQRKFRALRLAAPRPRYPAAGSCAHFARDPSAQGITVPEVKEE